MAGQRSAQQQGTPSWWWSSRQTADVYPANVDCACLPACPGAGRGRPCQCQLAQHAAKFKGLGVPRARHGRGRAARESRCLGICLFISTYIRMRRSRAMDGWVDGPSCRTQQVTDGGRGGCRTGVAWASRLCRDLPSPSRRTQVHPLGWCWCILPLSFSNCPCAASHAVPPPTHGWPALAQHCTPTSPSIIPR